MLSCGVSYRFKVFADYEAYVKCQERVGELYEVIQDIHVPFNTLMASLFCAEAKRKGIWFNMFVEAQGQAENRCQQ